MSVDLSTWYTKPQTLEKLNTSERTLDRIVERGELEKRDRRRPPLRPEPVYNPADVDKLADKEAGRSFLVPAGKENPRGAVLAPALQEAAAMLFEAMTKYIGEAGERDRALAQIMASLAPESRPVELPLWIGIEQAASYSGLPKGLLRRLAKEGKITAIRGRGWKIQRKSLDEWNGKEQIDELRNDPRAGAARA